MSDIDVKSTRPKSAHTDETVVSADFATIPTPRELAFPSNVSEAVSGSLSGPDQWKDDTSPNGIKPAHPFETTENARTRTMLKSKGVNAHHYLQHVSRPIAAAIGGVGLFVIALGSTLVLTTSQPAPKPVILSATPEVEVQPHVRAAPSAPNAAPLSHANRWHGKKGRRRGRH